MANSDIIRNNISNFYTNIPYDESAPTYIDSMLSNGTWSEINYSDIGQVYTHTRRNLAMAMHYKKTPSIALLDKITTSVNYMFDNILNTNDLWSDGDGWWTRDIGIPYYSYGELFIILYDNLSTSLKNKFQSYLLNYAAPIKSDAVYTGQNSIWSAIVRLIYSSLYGNQTYINRAIEIVNQTITVNAFGEGIQTDGSFHQHGDILYTGGYGQNFLLEPLKVAEFLSGTTLSLDGAKIEIIAGYFLKYLWVLHEGIEDYLVCGRESARPFSLGGVGKNAAMGALAILYNGYYGTLRQSILSYGKWAIQKNKLVGIVYDYFLPTLNTILSDQSIVATPVYGHTHFPYSDYSTHRRENSLVSLKMISNRTQTMEEISLEGKKGWHMTDGVLMRHKPGVDWRADNVLPVLDWNLLPGTTVSDVALPINQTKYGINQYCGNVNNGIIGISAMDYISPDYDLKAKKSWFFFDNEIVCIGSDIKGSVNNVTTVIDQLPLVDYSSPPTTGSNIRKIEDNCYYFFDDVSNVSFSKSNQSGKWSDIGEENSVEPIYDVTYTKPIYKITISHGSNPEYGKYAYIVFVDGDISTANARAVGNGYRVVSNNSMLHHVRNDGKGVEGLVFWEAGDSDIIGANKPCILLIEDIPGGKKISVSDPTFASSTIKLSIRGKYNTVNPNIQNASYNIYNDRTVFTVSVANGSSKTFTLVSSVVERVVIPIIISEAT